MSWQLADNERNKAQGAGLRAQGKNNFGF